MLGLSGAHLVYLVIFRAIVLLILGPGKLPEVGSGLGRAIREFRSASNDMKNQVVDAATKHEGTATPPAAPEVHPGEVAQPAQPVAGGQTSTRVGG